MTKVERPRVPIATAPPRGTSLFVTGEFPHRRWAVLLAALAVGALGA